MTTGHRFTYDERSSELFDATGHRLGVVTCPGAAHWNALWRTPPAVSDACCADCGRPILDLNSAPAMRRLADAAAQPELGWCVYAAPSAGVVLIRDPEALPSPADLSTDITGQVRIRTVRTLLNMHRAAAMGYWPDVRLVQPATSQLHQKIAVLQRSGSGQVRLTSDLGEWSRLRQARGQGGWMALFAPTHHYPYHQREAVAAYAVPRGLPDGTPVRVTDPIEDLVGSTWSGGDVWRAQEVSGVLRQHRVVLDPRPAPARWLRVDGFSRGLPAWR
jgi:hypothetical protein